MKVSTTFAILGVATSASALDLRGVVTVLQDAVADNSKDFFPAPEEMADNPNKRSASQKRQDQRNKRRESDNPNRSASENQRERDRKRRQASRSGNADRDPFDSRGRGSQRWRNTRNAQDRNRYGNRSDRDWSTSCRDYERSCRRDSRSDRNCRCEDFDYIEDMEMMSDFFEYFEDTEYIADFLADMYDY